MNENFVGTWKLIAMESRRSTGKVTYPFGKDIVGMIMYDAVGHMSVQIMRTDRPLFESGDIPGGTPDEIKAAFKGLITYFGTYEIDDGENVIIHQVESSSFPNWAGTRQKRFFEFSDNRLILSTPPIPARDDEITSVLIWERVA